MLEVSFSFWIDSDKSPETPWLENPGIKRPSLVPNILGIDLIRNMKYDLTIGFNFWVCTDPWILQAIDVVSSH